ncbi:unnamed protein product, partial [Rotaria socialis]
MKLKLKTVHNHGIATVDSLFVLGMKTIAM